jgi:hypothetical protein
MKSSQDSITYTTSAIAVIIAVVFTIAVPAAYFMISHQYMEGSIDAEADLTARRIEGLVMANPKMWQFEEVRLLELLQRRRHQDLPETRLIRDSKGDIVAKISEPLSPPLLTGGQDIYDAGVRIARIEISRSLVPLIASTAIVASVSFLLGIIVFIILRTIPLRAVRRAYQSLEESQQALRESKKFLETLIEAAPT